MTRAVLLSLLLPACGGTVAPLPETDAGDPCIAQQVACLRERIHSLSEVDAGVTDCELGWERCVGEIP